MKALVYSRSVPRYLASKLAARYFPKRFFPAISPLDLREVPFAKPGPGWAELEPLLVGICGSDLNLLKGAESFLLEPYASLPAILGHEAVAVLKEPAAGLPAGTRVVVEPVLGCAARGLPLCPNCQAGLVNVCTRFLDPGLGAGSFLGFHAKVGGAMAERFAAHESQILPVPDAVSTEDAALVDSMASVAWPILNHFPSKGQTVAIIGLGILGQHAVRLLRALGFDGRIVALARHPFQADLAAEGGADLVLRSSGRAELAQAVGGRFVPTTLGGGNIEGGADMVIDCVGSRRSVEDGLLALRARGTFVLVGTSHTFGQADVSSLWFRELTMVGSASYGSTLWQGTMTRTYALCLDLLAQGYPTRGLLTHRFTLDQWKEAFQAAFDKRGGGMKVCFDMR